MQDQNKNVQDMGILKFKTHVWTVCTEAICTRKQQKRSADSQDVRFQRTTFKSSDFKGHNQYFSGKKVYGGGQTPMTEKNGPVKKVFLCTSCLTKTNRNDHNIRRDTNLGLVVDMMNVYVCVMQYSVCRHQMIFDK